MILLGTLQALPSGDRKATYYIILFIIISSFNETLQYLNG